MKKIILLTLCALLALSPLAALAVGEKNKEGLPTGNLAGFDGGWTWFGEDFPYDITDTEACWELLQRPITVLDAEEDTPVYLLDAPDGEKIVNEWQGGFINGSQAAVHVLGEDEDGWTLIEGIDYYDRVLRGYVRTKLLKTVTPNEKYGIIIDKLTQRLYMFIDGELWSDCAVSTGLVDIKLNQPYNETATGEYLIGNWVGGFDSEGMYCDMGIRFNGGDLLHQVPGVPMRDGSYSYNKFGSQLGRKASHGCVRVQRTPNDDGLCIKWLWENLKRNTKVVVWDDDGRTIPYPDDDLELFYNPDGGSSYHASANCKSVREKYLPLTGFPYTELDTTYRKLEACPHCAPAQRRSVIDERNAENQKLGEYFQNPMYTGEEVPGGISVSPAASQEEEESYGEVSIIIK